MATQVQFRRGTTAQTAAFTGALAEVIVDIDKDTLVVYDGVTTGGFPLARESALNSTITLSQAGFDKANAANVLAQQAYDQANTGTTLAQTGFNKANSANVLAQQAYNQANTGTTVAQAGFDKANSANVLAQQGYDQGNTATTIAQAGFDKANSANVLAQSAFDQANTGTTIAQAGFNKANSANVLAQQAYDQANVGTNIANAGYNKANSANVLAQQAYDQANTGTTIANAGFDKANAANVLAQQAYDHANVAFSYGGNINGSVNVSTHISVGEYIDFNTTVSAPSQVEGRVFYDKDQHALTYYNEAGVHLQIGQEGVIRVWNNTASSMSDGLAVYISGPSSANGFPSVALANSYFYETSEVIGITTTVIPAGGYGYVTGFGKVNGLNTSAADEGEEVYLSDTTPGGLLYGTPPGAHATPLRLGVVSKKDSTNGAVLLDKTVREGANKTTGAILFVADGNLHEDPSNLFWNETNKRLGINTNTPEANLHVVGTALFTGNVQVTGNLQVTNAQFISTSQLTVTGNSIILNQDATGTPIYDATLVVNRGDSPNAVIRWDETNNEWTLDEADGRGPGHILTHLKTANTWLVYSSMDSYEKEYYPIGANLANAINELATTANTVANNALVTAQAGFNKANSANVLAQAAFDQANTGSTIAQSSYNQANTGTTIAQAGYNQANTANSIAANSVQTTGSTMTGTLTVPTLSANDTVSVNSTMYLGSTTHTLPTSGVQGTVDSWSSTSYRSAKYVAQMSSGSNYHMIEINVIHNGTTVYISQFGEVKTGASLGSFDGLISAGTFSLLCTADNNSTVVKLARTLIPV